jgi:formiminotetrahydrofolate cyclodeaminase
MVGAQQRPCLFGEFRLSDNQQHPREIFLERLSSGSAAPAGGAAAAYAGAMAAALAGMVARLTIGRKKYVHVEARMTEIAVEADRLLSQLQGLVHRDEAAYTNVMNAYKLPKATQQEQTERQRTVQAALHQAMVVQQQVVEDSLQVLGLLAEVAEQGNANAATDAAAGAAMARAAITAASINVRANLAELTDVDSVSIMKLLDEVKAQADVLEGRIREAVRTRTKILR